MDLQQLILFSLFLFFIVYMSFMFTQKRKRNGLGKRRKKKTVKREEAIVEEEPFFVPIQKQSKELFTEKGDRTHWYKITITFDTGEIREYDFYSYSSELSRDDIMNERFYVNDREIRIVDETGEHYINRNKVEQVDFLDRKLLADQIDSKESGDSFENDVREIEHQEVKESKVPVDLFDVEEEKEIENTLSKKGRFYREKKVKRPSIKKMEVKTFNRLFLSFVAFVLISGVFGLFRTFGLASRIDQVQVNQENQKNVNSDVVEVAESYPFATDSFLSEFITQYMYLSADSEEMNSRKETLSKFFSSNVSSESEDASTSRKLVSSQLNGIVDHENYLTASYRVVYTVDIPFEEIKKEKNGDTFEDVSYIEYETREKTVLMNIDYIEQDGQYSIISLPSFSAFEDRTMDYEGIPKNEESNTTVSADELKEVQTFLNIFFEKYANGTNEEITYLMKDLAVESLGGGYEVEEVSSVEAYTHEGFITVYAKVTFVESDSGLKHKEAFSMKLVKEEKQFKVNELKHNLGGF